MFRYEVLCILALGAVALPGCGGGGGTRTEVDTGSPAGDLRAVQISPAPGSVYISKETTFRLSWPQRNAPATFTVELMRYREARGGEERSVEGQRTRLDRQGDAFVWDLKRTDNFTLDDDGVYFLRLRSGPDEVQAAYIVAGGRALAAPTRATGEEPTIGDSVRHTVTVR
jgi:hypothetical protein